MANHPQAEKRNRQRIKRQARNRHYKTAMRSLIKKLVSAIDDKDSKTAKDDLQQAVPVIDRCAQKGIIPRARASRIISRLTKTVSSL